MDSIHSEFSAAVLTQLPRQWKLPQFSAESSALAPAKETRRRPSVVRTHSNNVDSRGTGFADDRKLFRV